MSAYKHDGSPLFFEHPESICYALAREEWAGRATVAPSSSVVVVAHLRAKVPTAPPPVAASPEHAQGSLFYGFRPSQPPLFAPPVRAA